MTTTENQKICNGVARIWSEAVNENDRMPLWLHIVWEVNNLVPETFGKPDYLGDWWAGGSVEEYAGARIIHKPDATTVIVAKNQIVAEAIDKAYDTVVNHA